MGNRAILIALVAACGGDDSNDSACSVNDDCELTDVCVAQACAPAVPRTYAILNLNLQVPTTKPDGQPWDAGGGATAAPDVYVEIVVNDNTPIVTPVVDDSYSPQFSGAFNVNLENDPGSPLSLTLAAFDEDLADDDPVFTCAADPLTVAVIRGRVLLCQNSGYTLGFTLAP